MLGLLLLYWIGKYYYKLAEAYNKSQWGFAILGIVTYYVGTFFFGIMIVIAMEIASPGYVDTVDDFLLSLMALPFGILSTYLLYIQLEKSWKKQFLNASTFMDSTDLEENSKTIQ